MAGIVSAENSMSTTGPMIRTTRPSPSASAGPPAAGALSTVAVMLLTSSR